MKKLNQFIGISVGIGLVFSIIQAQNVYKNSLIKFYKTAKNQYSLKDTVVLKDSLPTDTLKVGAKKEALADIVTHTADDYIKVDMENSITTLYNNAKLHYQDVDLEAGIIIIDYKNNLIRAKGIVDDSLGYTQLPHFKQGAEETTQDSLLVNYNTERALIWGLQTTQENGLIVSSQVSKKVNDSTMYVRNIVVTTSDKKKPDYHIGIDKAKIIPGKRIIAGSSLLYIEDVPTPAYLPFAYFPLTKTRTSGILVPTWGESYQQGYFLQNGGYYFAISDYVDLALTGDIYTNSSWGLSTRSNYKWRYRFSGSFNVTYENNIYSLKGFDDYSKNTQFNIIWNHSQDATANPNAHLSASVNLASNSRYFRESLNEYSSNSFLNNNLNSSISYNKKFNGTPFNMSVSAQHSQNTNTKLVTLSLPALQLNMETVYPFVAKNGTKDNMLKKIGVNYNMSGDYRISTNDDDFLTSRMFNNSKKGVSHTLSASTSTQVFNYFNLSPSLNYKEYWYFDYLQKRFDTATDTIATDSLKGFKTLREYGTGVSLSTNVYGTFNFKKGRLKAIRHTVRPSISYNFRPDFGFYDEEVYDYADNRTLTYSPYEGSMYGVPGKGISNSIGFSLGNTFEAKVMEKDSTKTDPKKVVLLNNLNFNTNYDLTRDSLKLSAITFSGGTQLFNNKLNLSFNGRLNPYMVNDKGQSIDEFRITNGQGLIGLSNVGVSLNFSLSDALYKKQTAENPTNKNQKPAENILGGDIKEISKTDNNPKVTKKTKIYYTDIPWSMSVQYNLQYANEGLTTGITSNTVNFSGNIELTPKWKIGYNSGYDFKYKGIPYTSLSFHRDLDSWKFDFNWVPFGRSTYYFFIGVKSSVLSDLKYDKQGLPDKRLF